MVTTFSVYVCADGSWVVYAILDDGQAIEVQLNEAARAALLATFETVGGAH